MQSKTVKILSICFLVATFVVIALYGLSEKIVREPNSFLRVYPPHLAGDSKELDVNFNSYYIAGVTSDQIYLANFTAPTHLLVANKTLTDTQHIRLKIKNVESLKLTKYLRITVDSPFFFITDGYTPVMLRGRLNEWEADRFMADSAYFTQAQPINSTSFGIRTKSSTTRENVLGKMFNEEPYVKLENSLLQKQIDGIFCTDGLLSYNKFLNRFVYTYYYRNEYIVYDTNMNLDYRGHTIDTFSRAQVKVAEISSEATTTLATKPKVINKQSTVSGPFLFINSSLLAKNDLPNLFENASVIDVYDLRSNKYKLSFTISNRWGGRLREFRIYNNEILIGLFDHHLVVEQLKKEYL